VQDPREKANLYLYLYLYIIPYVELRGRSQKVREVNYTADITFLEREREREREREGGREGEERKSVRGLFP